jgi:GT2 family glycosyltransferase
MYNDFMTMLPSNDDFACFVDGDTIFTTSNYGHTIQDAVQSYPDVGCFTCYTNRVYNTAQIVEGIDYDSNDVIYHRQIGNTLQTVFGSTCVDITEPLVERGKPMYISGVMILIKKSLWKKIGGFKNLNGMLGVDNELHKDIIAANEKIYLMKGVYLYHWYRWPDIKNISHLL